MLANGLILPSSRFPTACRELEYGDTKRRCWRALWRRWHDMPGEPLHVIGRLASGYVAAIDDAIHLDALLSAACFSLYPSVVDDGIERYVIPLPIALLWVSPAECPLWATSDLRPSGAYKTGATYIHSRYPADRADLARHASVLTTAGRYKDTRRPLQIIATAAVEGWCFGLREPVFELLSRITHIGVKSAHGHGRVLSWSVEPASSVSIEAILDRRPVPIDYLATHGETVESGRVIPRQGWTPPYWHPECQGMVRRAIWTQ
jgi:hypothetical protein